MAAGARLPDPQVRASDRTSRYEMALLLPSPPTALLVMSTDIVNGIVDSQILNFLAVWCKRSGSGLHVAIGV